MPRYNKILSGPWSESLPQVREALASEAITPGCVVVMNSSGQFELADANTVGKVYIAQDNYLALKGVDDDWASGSRMIGIEMLDEFILCGRVATGNDLDVGTPLTPAANGLLAIAALSDKVVAYADEAYNNDTGSSQLVRIRPGQGYLTAAS